MSLTTQHDTLDESGQAGAAIEVTPDMIARGVSILDDAQILVPDPYSLVRLIYDAMARAERNPGHPC